MNDAQMTCVAPAEVLCINAPCCCRHALNYRQMTYSGTIDLNMTREETIVLMCTYRGGGQQPNIPDGEPDLGPNNDTTAEGLVYTNRAASLKPDSESIAGGGTPKNSSAGDKPDLGPYNDEYNLFGGKSTDSDWLSLKHISDCLELLLHTNYRYACHQPTTGSSHDVCSDRTLQNILDTAAEAPSEKTQIFPKSSLTLFRRMDHALQLLSEMMSTGESYA